jgi:phosphatidylinositol kinase/protein kinase (PI-3  family)
MDKMRLHSPKLVEQVRQRCVYLNVRPRKLKRSFQALLVSQELIRVAILWHEMWHEGLEEASRLYFGDHNIEAMFTVLEPLHRMLERVSPLGYGHFTAEIDLFDKRGRKR